MPNDMSLSVSNSPEVYQGGSGTPLVFVHGFGSTWRQWRTVIPYVERHHRVIVPTLPGHYGGLPIRSPVSPAAIAEALAQQLRDMGIEKAHIVGQSLGGYVSIELARRGIATSVIVFSPGGAWSSEAARDAVFNKIRGSFKLMPYLLPLLRLALRPAWLRKRLLRDEMEHADRMTYAEAMDMVDRGLKTPVAGEFLQGGFDMVEPLPADAPPVRVVWCEKDRVLPFENFGQPFLDRLGLKTHGVLKDCGHNPVFDDPEGLAKAVLAFTRRVEERA